SFDVRNVTDTVFGEECRVLWLIRRQAVELLEGGEGIAGRLISRIGSERLLKTAFGFGGEFLSGEDERHVVKGVCFAAALGELGEGVFISALVSEYQTQVVPVTGVLRRQSRGF